MTVFCAWFDLEMGRFCGKPEEHPRHRCDATPPERHVENLYCHPFHSNVAVAERELEALRIEMSMMRDLLSRKQDEIARLRGELAALCKCGTGSPCALHRSWAPATGTGQNRAPVCPARLQHGSDGLFFACTSPILHPLPHMAKDLSGKVLAAWD